MTQRDRRAIIFGGGALAALAFVWLMLLPGLAHWSAARDGIAQSHEQLERIQDQTRRLAALDRQLEPVIGPAINKPLATAAAARTQLLKDLIDLHNRSGAQISSVQPEPTRTIQELPGVVRIGVQVQAMGPPIGLVQLLAGAKNNQSTILLLDRMDASTGPQGPMQMKYTTVWSTLARQDGSHE